jgi:hypothetical protein
MAEPEPRNHDRMSFNPWAVALFLFGGIALHQSGLATTGVLAVYFLGFLVVWLGCSFLWDWIRFRNKT